MSSHSKRIRDVARKVFDYNSLRPGQEEAIASILDGQDTMVIMPTGGGKSAIYQIAALLIDGPTVVISPLIALQKDQSERLNVDGPGGAAVVNSLASTRDRKTRLQTLRRGSRSSSSSPRSSSPIPIALPV